MLAYGGYPVRKTLKSQFIEDDLIESVGRPMSVQCCTELLGKLDFGAKNAPPRQLPIRQYENYRHRVAAKQGVTTKECVILQSHGLGITHFFILDREEVFADSVLLTLIGADAFKFLDKAAALHNHDGSLIIHKANTGDFGESQLGHDDR